MKNTLFRNEWNKLEKYYKKAHTRDESNFYYSKLKDLSDDDFLAMLDNVYKNCKFFPNIAEFREQVPTNKKNLDEKKWKQWSDIKKVEVSKDELKELEELFDEFKNK